MYSHHSIGCSTYGCDLRDNARYIAHRLCDMVGLSECSLWLRCDDANYLNSVSMPINVAAGIEQQLTVSILETIYIGVCERNHFLGLGGYTLGVLHYHVRYILLKFESST